MSTTIEELHQEKRQLQRDIFKLVSEFEERHGIVVNEIENTFSNVVGRPRRTKEILIELRL